MPPRALGPPRCAGHRESESVDARDPYVLARRHRPVRGHRLPELAVHLDVALGIEIGVNPYGQPGVEAYKKNMNAILRGA